jgi:hypothetical protein
MIVLHFICRAYATIQKLMPPLHTSDYETGRGMFHCAHVRGTYFRVKKYDKQEPSRGM